LRPSRDEKFLILENGQRLEKVALDKPDMTVAEFKTYGAQVDADDQSARSFMCHPAQKAHWSCLQSPNKVHLAELSWRAGLALAAINLVIIGLVTAGRQSPSWPYRQFGVCIHGVCGLFQHADPGQKLD
jgi:lipopolysaccharide export system permease protein